MTLVRKKNLLQAKLMAAKFANDQLELHRAMPPRLAKVLEGKPLLLWKSLLEKDGYDDLGFFLSCLRGSSWWESMTLQRVILFYSSLLLWLPTTCASRLCGGEGLWLEDAHQLTLLTLSIWKQRPWKN